jgi:hypothetical protein
MKVRDLMKVISKSCKVKMRVPKDVGDLELRLRCVGGMDFSISNAVVLEGKVVLESTRNNYYVQG